ncbi:hypothetical protein JL722_10148 [Aureococcus anophagefferens]|nr:hypothetical protein JL722_10148 [Aureococcus anophagefferens]
MAPSKRTSSLFLVAPLAIALFHVVVHARAPRRRQRARARRRRPARASQAPAGHLPHLDAGHMPRSRSRAPANGAPAALLRRVEALEARQAAALAFLAPPPPPLTRRAARAEAAACAFDTWADADLFRGRCDLGMESGVADAAACAARLRVMVDKNCDVPHHLSERLDSDGAYGWKHDFVPDGFDGRSRDALVVVFRSAATTSTAAKRLTLAQYVAAAFAERGRTYAGVLAMRDAKYTQYRDVLRRCPNAIGCVEFNRWFGWS